MFVCETEIDDAEIQAGLAGGILTAWRIDSAGRQWFRQMPLIHGVPKPADTIVNHQLIGDDLEADYLDEDDIEAEDADCEIVAFDDDGEEVRAIGEATPLRGVDAAASPIQWGFRQ